MKSIFQQLFSESFSDVITRVADMQNACTDLAASIEENRKFNENMFRQVTEQQSLILQRLGEMDRRIMEQEKKILDTTSPTKFIQTTPSPSKAPLFVEKTTAARSPLLASEKEPRRHSYSTEANKVEQNDKVQKENLSERRSPPPLSSSPIHQRKRYCDSGAERNISSLPRGARRSQPVKESSPKSSNFSTNKIDMKSELEMSETTSHIHIDQKMPTVSQKKQNYSLENRRGNTSSKASYRFDWEEPTLSTRHDASHIAIPDFFQHSLKQHRTNSKRINEEGRLKEKESYRQVLDESTTIGTETFGKTDFLSELSTIDRMYLK
jgi:hypothetical protein